MTIFNPNKRFFTLAVFLTAVFLISSCSTKKNTAFRRAYHNLTCHYNVWWNGDVSLAEGAKSLKESAKDNYNEVLRVYNYGTKQDAQSLNPKMDRAIEKASIGIQRHSMYFGGKEYVKWVDDSYMMMGKAHFYKQDYTSARRVFDYIAKEYADEPIHYEALLWLAKTYIETERFEKAEAALNQLMTDEQSGKKLPRQVAKDLPMVYADFYIAQEKYDEAYPYLERGLELGNKKDVLTRAEFILGQINQLQGDLDFATRYYKKVIKRNPDYRMAFEARINMAKCYDEGSGESKNINKLLLKMAKDAKNKEFLGQIYYALGEVAQKDQNDTLAIYYFRKSVAGSGSDNYQKTTSAITVADLFFQKSNYKMAQAYYDTAVGVIPVDYPNMEIIKNKAEVLTELVTYTRTISEKDSLLRLAEMDTNQLYVLIDGIIERFKKKKAEQEALAEQMMEEGNNMAAMPGGPARGGGPGGPPSLGGAQGKWYFYNPQSLSFGRQEFTKKWGSRKLEDNWRLSDKRMLMSAFDEGGDAGDEQPAGSDSTQTAEAPPTDPEQRDYYLVDIPYTDEEKEAAHQEIIESYAKLGYLYLEGLKDTAIAVETYREFLKKYPDNKYRLQAWYALYKVYNERGDTEKAAMYKNLIVTNYPDSDYAKVIVDPDYFVKLREQKGEAAKLYEKTYKAFKREQYYRVITYAERGIEQFAEDTALVPRFLYMRALALGKVNVPDTMYTAINELIQKYPSSPVIPMAKSVLRVLQSEYGIGEGAAEGKAERPGDKSLYNYDPDEMHLVILLVYNEEVNINALKIRLSDFKNKYFRLDRLRIKSLMLDKQRTLITVGNFDDAADAEDFESALVNDEYVLSGMEGKNYAVASMSVANYPTFFKDKDIDKYLEFYNAFYKNEEKQ